MDIKYKHYVKHDKNKNVIDYHSDAFPFKENDPIENYTFLHQGGYHFEFEGIKNPAIKFEDGCPIYKGNMEKRTEEENKQWRLEKYMSIENLKYLRFEEFKLIDVYTFRMVHGELTPEQEQEFIIYRKAWLDVTETKVIPEKPNWLV